MKYFIKKIYSILLLITILFFATVAFAKSGKIEYSRGDISNYFSGIISANQDNNVKAFKYLNKVQSIRNSHTNYNIQFIRTLILLDKFEQAFAFSKSIWTENESFFEIDLLLGLESFIKKDYSNAEKYFKRLNNAHRSEFLLEGFLGDFLLAWIRAAENNKSESLKFFDKIPTHYSNLKKIQNIFLQCYFDTPGTQENFEKLTSSEDFIFSRYNFFLVNYLLYKNKNKEAEKITKLSRKKHDSNLLIKQTENFILTKKNKKIKDFFNCKNPNDVIAEVFYIIANLYSTENDYQLSNFYLKI